MKNLVIILILCLHVNIAKGEEPDKQQIYEQNITNYLQELKPILTLSDEQLSLLKINLVKSRVLIDEVIKYSNGSEQQEDIIRELQKVRRAIKRVYTAEQLQILKEHRDNKKAIILNLNN